MFCRDYLPRVKGVRRERSGYGLTNKRTAPRLDDGVFGPAESAPFCNCWAWLAVEQHGYGARTTATNKSELGPVDHGQFRTPRLVVNQGNVPPGPRGRHSVVFSDLLGR